MGRVDGKVALVAGGARGIGGGCAERLVAEGAHVVIGDILDDDGKALADQLGDAARYVHLDVTDPEQWQSAVATAQQEFGSLSVLVNSAGIANGSALQTFDLAQWQRVLDINLTGTFLGMQASADALIASGAGSIVNVSSIEGVRGTGWAHGYVASKWAVRGITKSVAMELAPHGVRCNSIHPGLIRTPLTEKIPDNIIKIPMGRAGTIAEVANLVLFLASDESSYMTGSEVVIDGGTVQCVPSGM
jgi:3alpha(or 20beta)-hydroxysteroid dehydrogenase